MAGYKIKGIPELRRTIEKLGPSLLPHIAVPVREFTQQIASSAGSAVPVDEGELRASQFTEGPDIDSHALRVHGTVGYSAPHAPFVHEAGRKSPKWLERSVQGKGRAFAKAVERALFAGIAAVAPKGDPK